MALEYRLVLAGPATAEEVAERAMTDTADRPSGDGPLLTADLFAKYGFLLTVRAGKNAYVEVEADDESWLWEPAEYVSVNFRMDKFADLNRSVIHMLTVVRRLLSTGSEDAALVLNGDVLLLTRLHGAVAKYRREQWWLSYPGADDVIDV
nr:SitI3 family protein [uncultured Actinoplanes sp.]